MEKKNQKQDLTPDSQELRRTTFVIDGIPMDYDQAKKYRADKAAKAKAEQEALAKEIEDDANMQGGTARYIPGTHDPDEDDTD